MSDLQRAIDFVEELRISYLETSSIKLPNPDWLYSLAKHDDRRNMFDTALTALREKQERGQGCKYCAINDWERKPLATFNTYFNNYEEEQHEIGIDDYEGGYRIASTLGNNGPSVDIRFCPNCGRNLTEKEDKT